jgi:hypothetical protein
VCGTRVGDQEGAGTLPGLLTEAGLQQCAWAPGWHAHGQAAGAWGRARRARGAQLALVLGCRVTGARDRPGAHGRMCNVDKVMLGERVEPALCTLSHCYCRVRIDMAKAVAHWRVLKAAGDAVAAVGEACKRAVGPFIGQRGGADYDEQHRALLPAYAQQQQEGNMRVFRLRKGAQLPGSPESLEAAGIAAAIAYMTGGHVVNVPGDENCLHHALATLGLLAAMANDNIYPPSIASLDSSSE